MDKLTKIFNQVRDIPYNIPLSPKETDYCCSGKHKIFKQLLENLAYQVRYRVVSFTWDSLKLPTEIFAIPHENSSTHVYLEIFIDNQWQDVDVTWDIGLKSIFPINQWNGGKNIIAVPVLKKFSSKKSQEIMDNETEEEITNDLKINGKFYEAFNWWLESNNTKI